MIYQEILTKRKVRSGINNRQKEYRAIYIKGDKEEVIMVKGTLHQEDIIIMNLHASKNMNSKP